MKLNSLIKYNSLKIFSVIGYISLVSFTYIEFIVLPDAFKIDKAAGCHFAADYPLCTAHGVEIVSAFVFCGVAWLGILSLIALLFEFLWKKDKSKDATERKYPIYAIIPFWIGAAVETLLCLIFLWLLFQP